MMLRVAFVPPDEVVEELRALSGRLGMLPGVRSAPNDRLDVPIASLGNVSRADTAQLARRIAASAGPETLPQVGLSGVHLQPDGDIGITVTGDVTGLYGIAGAVGKSAERIHVYIDRRAFRPLLVVAQIDEQKPGSRVEPTLARMEDWTCMSWTVADVALIQIRWHMGLPFSEIVEFVPITPARAVVPSE
ncbi:hypothetical protein [Nocardioides sp. WS12]|uniref:2'-5' RNA ligase family protein n=1 Tax=Nocardioides sp. WS12 TaxID=2486272 RepID=UPI0015FDE2BC|nr:hypothetical protein [Nocardioides sp. WS12]